MQFLDTFVQFLQECPWAFSGRLVRLGIIPTCFGVGRDDCASILKCCGARTWFTMTHPTSAIHFVSRFRNFQKLSFQQKNKNSKNQNFRNFKIFRTFGFSEFSKFSKIMISQNIWLHERNVWHTQRTTAGTYSAG